MDFRILGPLEAFDGGQRVALGGSKRRAVLALLLLHAGETLTTDGLVDELWGEQQPTAAAKTAQVHISRLRKVLADAGAADLLVTRENGYELVVEPERIDAHRFERLVAEGGSALSAGEPDAALEALEAALSLWRGPPLADLAYEPFVQQEAAHLEELRVTALEQLVEAKLVVGRHAEVIGQLEQLVSEHPYRENLRAQLMLALYRADRQADALQAYQDARRMLVEELGIEPGERLRALEAAVLAQDPALAAPATAPPPPAAAEPPPAPPPMPRPPEKGAAARRLVSIVFADLVGSTGLAEHRARARAGHRDRHEARCRVRRGVRRRGCAAVALRGGRRIQRRRPSRGDGGRGRDPAWRERASPAPRRRSGGAPGAARAEGPKRDGPGLATGRPRRGRHRPAPRAPQPLR